MALLVKNTTNRKLVQSKAIRCGLLNLSKLPPRVILEICLRRPWNTIPPFTTFAVQTLTLTPPFPPAQIWEFCMKMQKFVISVTSEHYPKTHRIQFELIILLLTNFMVYWFDPSMLFYMTRTSYNWKFGNQIKIFCRLNMGLWFSHPTVHPQPTT